ncbi:MAG TPA: type II toxin-antitoxin system death-on-curing family toxin [Trueperaceae bacterium]
MNKKKRRVDLLARQAGRELDDALLLLWDAGLDHVLSPGYVLKGSELERARRALGLTARRDLASLRYWSARLGVGIDDLQDLLAAEGLGRPPKDGRLRKQQINWLSSYPSRERAAGSTHIDAFSEADRSSTSRGEVSTKETDEAFVWTTIGRETSLRYLDVNEVEAIHEELVRDFASDSDPIQPAGVRDRGLLEGAVHRPHTALGEKLKYPTVEMAGAALLCSLVHDHPFHNGNKRTALVSLLVFLDENGLLLECEDDAIFQLVLRLARHGVVDKKENSLADREVLYVAKWLKDRTRWIERGDRPIPWRRLRQIITSFGCQFESTGNGPGRYRIERTIRLQSRFLGRNIPRTRKLTSVIQVVDDGRDLPAKTIKKVRSELELDEEHGVDSQLFYVRGGLTVSAFIARYRKLLKRLARL